MFRSLVLAFAASLIFVGVHAAVFSLPQGQEIELIALDAWFQARGEKKPSDDVILIAIDEASYEELNFPMSEAWPRAAHARLLERLAAAGAKKVVFDVIFGGPGSDPEGDQALARAFSLLPTAIGVDSGLAPGSLDLVETYLPYKPFTETAEELALVALPTREENVRTFKTSRSSVTSSYPSLAEAGANAHVKLENLPDQNDLINYYGPAGTIPTYSYYEALNSKLLPDRELRGKTVFVGLILRTELGPAQKDSFLTPFPERGRTFGVEIHAAAASNLIEAEWIKRAPFEEELLLLSAVGAGIGTFLFLLPPLLGFLLLLLSVGAWGWYAYSSFLSLQFLPGLVLVGLVLPLLYFVRTVVFAYLTLKKQRQTEKAFSLYLSPEMARQVSRDPDRLNLGGETVEASAVFTDIADFTKVSEQMSAEEVVQMLNAYFEGIVHVIFESKGTLNKFIGDAVFAIWGAPIENKEHAQSALDAALKIRNAVREFNKESTYPELHTRIGIHSGPMVVGNLGSTKRFDYTAIGDSVNLASRIEGMNKYLGTELLFTDTVHSKVRASEQFCTMGKVAVKGRSEPVEIFTVLPAEASREETEQWLAATEHFRGREWDEADAAYEAISKGDGFFAVAAAVYREHIPALRFMSEEESWSGEIIFEVK